MKKLLKWPPFVAFVWTPIAALLVSLALVGCMSLITSSGEKLKGLDVEKVTEVLRTLADEVEKFDANDDGLITRDEASSIALSLGSRLYLQMRAK